jgi:hypothetical protein
MQGENKERWMELCRQASTEQDPVVMLQLITEINDLLAEKEKRLINARFGTSSPVIPTPKKANFKD